MRFDKDLMYITKYGIVLYFKGKIKTEKPRRSYYVLYSDLLNVEIRYTYSGYPSDSHYDCGWIIKDVAERRPVNESEVLELYQRWTVETEERKPYMTLPE